MDAAGFKSTIGFSVPRLVFPNFLQGSSLPRLDQVSSWRILVNPTLLEFWKQEFSILYFIIFMFSVLYNIMANEFVSAEFKERLRMSAKHGRDEGTCMVSI